MMVSALRLLTFEVQLVRLHLQVQLALTARPVLQAQQVLQAPPVRRVQIALSWPNRTYRPTGPTGPTGPTDGGQWFSWPNWSTGPTGVNRPAGPTGDGFTGGSYAPSTGVVTFTSTMASVSQP